MGALPPVDRILREDIPDAPAWVDRIIYPINRFLESVTLVLNKNITFVDNIPVQIAEFTFTTLSTYNGTAANFTTIQFQRTLAFKPRGLLLMQIFQTGGNHVPIESAVYIDWLDVNGVVTIYTITGLTASRTYTCRVMAI